MKQLDAPVFDNLWTYFLSTNKVNWPSFSLLTAMCTGSLGVASLIYVSAIISTVKFSTVQWS